MNKTELSRYVRLIQDVSMQPLMPLPPELSEEWERFVPKKGTALLDRIRAVLFDIYGTLFVSGAGEIAADPDHPLAPAAATTSSHIEEMEAYFRQEVQSRHKKSRDLGIDWPEVRVEEIWAHYTGKIPDAWNIPQKNMEYELAVHYELAVNPVYPMPHAESLLRSLVTSGRKLGIISNAQFFTPLLFNAFFKKSPEELGFDPCLCIYSFEEKEAKPSARLFIKAQKLLELQNIKPEETLYIGNDMRNDIIPAAAAGFITALFAGDRRSLRLRENDSACKGKKPSMLIRDFDLFIQELGKTDNK